MFSWSVSVFQSAFCRRFVKTHYSEVTMEKKVMLTSLVDESFLKLCGTLERADPGGLKESYIRSGLEHSEVLGT